MGIQPYCKTGAPEVQGSRARGIPAPPTQALLDELIKLHVAWDHMMKVLSDAVPWGLLSNLLLRHTLIYIYIWYPPYICAHLPYNTQKCTFCRFIPNSLFSQRLRKSKNPKIQNSKNPKIKKQMQDSVDVKSFGF